MKNKRFLFILLCSILMTGVHGENPPAKVVFEQYMNQAQTFAETYPREKAYLHFDNTGYFLGEKIWFKAYVTRAYDCKPTDISRVLYVELVNPSGEVIKKRNLKSTTTDRPTETSHLTVYTARTSMKYEPIHAI